MSAWIAAILMLACLLGGCTCHNRAADHTYRQYKYANNTTYRPFFYKCQLDEPVAACQVKNLADNDVTDLNTESGLYFASPDIFGGQCGIRSIRRLALDEIFMYGCRTRTEDSSQWQYTTAIVHHPDSNFVDGMLEMETTPPGKQVVVAGWDRSRVNLNFTAKEPLWKCEFKWPGQATWISEGGSVGFEIDNSGLEQGRCGVKVIRKSEEQSGIVITRLLSKNNTEGKHKEYIHMATLTVIPLIDNIYPIHTSPSPITPALSLNKADGVYNEGDVMLASCHLGHARPVPRVTWLLGNDVIEGEFEDLSTWPWNYEAANVTRKLSRKLSVGDDGKELVCRVHHVFFNMVPAVKIKITVRSVTGCGIRLGNDIRREFMFPWHVVVYRKQDSSLELSCSGTLITAKYFVTAARCFWSQRDQKPLSKSLLKVVLGKTKLLWEEEDKSGEQRRDIKEVHFHENFDGDNMNLESDIAVVELSSRIQLTREVNVICLDWTNAFEDQQLAGSTLGTVPLWGASKSGNPSGRLQYADLPFVSKPECRAHVPWDFKESLVLDKFCGGFSNKSTYFCPGDQGGGFVFPITTTSGLRFYLRGVVSISPGMKLGNRTRCEKERLTAFTKVSMYLSWVKGIVFAE